MNFHFALLHSIILLYSVSGVFGKLAAQQKFLSVTFCLYYGVALLLLGIYALGWQQVIKRLPLTTAYANKAVTVVWGIMLGTAIFHEQIRLRQLLGAVVVIIGVVLFTTADLEKVA